MKAIAVSEEDRDVKRFSDLLGKANAEMRELHDENEESDKEIQKLLESNRKALRRIRENISHVEANL